MTPTGSERSQAKSTMTLTYLAPLPLETLRAHGVGEPFRFGHADRVRFHELDVLDHVNNAVYLSWFENFRLAYLRDYGISNYTDTGNRPVLVIRNVDLEYRAPLHLDDTYIVAGRSMTYRNTSWKMQYGVFAHGKLCVLAHAVIVTMQPDAKTRKALPQSMIDVISARDGAVHEPS
jgi:acyl-CoA thioester hydrolase